MQVRRPVGGGPDRNEEGPGGSKKKRTINGVLDGIRFESKQEIHKIVQMKEGAVYRTKKIAEAWVPADATEAAKNEIVKRHGGDMTVVPSSPKSRIVIFDDKTGKIVSSKEV